MGYPLVVFAVSAAFCAAVGRQYVRRRRPYQLAWVCSLASAAGGSLAYVVFLAAGKSEIAFRLYYIFGALLTAPLLGIGSLLLVTRSDAGRRRAGWFIAVVLLGCLAGVVLLLTNPVNASILHQLNGGPGSDPDVYTAGAWKPLLVALNIAGALCVFGVAAYSAWGVYSRSGTRRLLIANVLIAAGTFLISQAGGQARTGLGAGAFWLTMMLGWIVLFGGFLCTFSYHGETQRAAAAVGRQSVAAG